MSCTAGGFQGRGFAVPELVPGTPVPSGGVGPRHRVGPPVGELASGDGTIRLGRRNQFLALPRWRAPEPTALDLASSLPTPARPLAPARRLLPYRGRSVSEAGQLRARPPRTPAQVAAGSALRAVWVSAGSLHPSAQGRGCLGSTRSSRRRPSPVARGEGGDTGWGGGNGGVGRSEALARTQGEGAARSPTGVGPGPFSQRRQETSVQLTGAAGAGEVAQDGVHREGLGGGRLRCRRSYWPSTLSLGFSFPPGTRRICLILV